MGESFKNKILDKALDKALDGVFDLLIGKTKDELIEIIFKDDMKKTLYKVMKDFSENEYFKYGFRGYLFLGDYIYMNEFNNDMFKLTLSFDELRENIKKVIGIYFVSDINDKTNELTEIISNKFLEKASLKANLADLLIKQEKIYMETKEQLDKQMTLLNEIKNQKYDEEKYKKDLMKNELKMLITQELSNIANRYVYFVVKEPFSIDANMDFFRLLKELINKIDEYVREDFFKKPVKILEAEPDIVKKFFNGDRSFEKYISYKNFAYFYFKTPIIDRIDNLNKNYSNQLTKTFLENLIKLKSKLNETLLFTGLEFGIDIDIENASFDVTLLRGLLKEIGLIIIALYEEIEG
ncbi:hypothetical protein [Clostridium perfringens]|uniref:hypothetical protein n=1 Tax=Clostridium perfringens TaxID=1502 RepID=UPI0024BD1151|nr:hypothetical protein [Clostridium perfringens]